METIKPGQFVELTYDLFVGSENISSVLLLYLQVDRQRFPQV